VRYPLCPDVLKTRLNSEKLSELPSQAGLSEIRGGLIVWNSLRSDHGDASWAIVDGMRTVRTCHGSKSMKFDGGSPEGLVKDLTWEIESDLDGIKE